MKAQNYLTEISNPTISSYRHKLSRLGIVEEIYCPNSIWVPIMTGAQHPLPNYCVTELGPFFYQFTSRAKEISISLM